MHSRDAWDMAAEICLSQLPSLVEDPNAEFQVCFYSESFANMNTQNFPDVSGARQELLE